MRSIFSAVKLSQVTRIFTFALILLTCTTNIAFAGSKRSKVQAKIRAQMQKGAVRLDLVGLPFGDLNLAQARETAAGNYTGQVGLGTRTFSAMLHFVPYKPKSDDGNWILALRQDFVRTSEIIPLLKNTIVDQLNLSQPVIAFSVERVVGPQALLGADTKKFYGKFVSPQLEISKGINLLTAATPAPNSPIEKALKILKIGNFQLNLHGILLRDFSLKDLKEAKANGKLKLALRRGLELRAGLPAIQLKGLPRGFKTSRAFLYVTGEPGVGVAFGMTYAQPGNGLRTFDCDLSITKDLKQITSVMVVAGTKGSWPNSFGIRGFNLNEVSLMLSVDTAQRVGFGLRAGMNLGSKKLLLAGQLKIHTLTGAVTEGMFEGEVSSLGIHDLVSMANTMGRNSGHKGRGLNPNSVPEFGLRDVYVRYAPMEGNHKLGIKRGIALRGNLIFNNKQLLKVDALVDQASIVPTIRVKGKANKINLGIMAIEKANVDVNIGLKLNPYFKVQGEWRQWISKKKLDVHVSRSKLAFAVEDRVAGLYKANFSVSSPVKGRANWRLNAAFKNEFAKTLEEDVSKKALAWAAKVKRDSAGAAAKVRNERSKVESLDRQINKVKAEVRARRQRNVNNLRKAEASVAALDVKIKARQKIVDKRLAPLRKAASALKARMNKAQSAYNSAVKERKRAKGPKKVAAKIKEAAKWTALKEATATYKTANGKLAKALVRVDPELQKLKISRGTALATLKSARFVYEKTIAAGPVETDPKVAGLIASQKTAIGLLIAAEAVVKGYGHALAGAGKITAAAARNKGKVISLRSATLNTEFFNFKRGGSFTLVVKCRFLKKDHTLRLTVNTNAIRKKIVFGNVWKILKKKDLD